MSTYRRWIAGLAFMLAFVCVGCSGPSKRLNAPPQGQALETSMLQDYYTFMLDNAMLYDMCIADLHFVPHTAEINGLGARRLEGYSRLLKDRGGTIHLETISTDDQLTEARIKNVSDFLASSGLNPSDVMVEVGLPRGRAIEAAEAVRIKQEGTANDLETASGSAGGL